LILSGCSVTRNGTQAGSSASGAAGPALLASGNGAPAAQAASTAFGADAISTVAKKDTPGVVQITNEQVQLGAMGQGGGQAVPAGVGTGIVLDNQGHILTNDHVVAGAQKLVVTLSNGSKEYPATLVGGDARSDLAVIQVSGANIPPLALGDSSKLQVGQWVIAIGNALALPGGPTVTAGVVSALNRTVQEPGQPSSSNPNAQSAAGGPFLFDAIQTDAPINPGNSGGPLVDLNGDVVGINTLGAGQAEPGVQSEGIGFAISINTAKKIANQLIAQGHITYAFLGVGTMDNTPALAAQYGLPNVPGAAVLSVATGSPAAQAGIASKDVITAIGNTQIASTSDVQLALTFAKPGDKVSVSWVQAGTNQKVTKTVTLAQAPAA
ncbi:MAG TPA: trypsin-like peptidase domain-containing protein, partial [Chloroflexota bacterium]